MTNGCYNISYNITSTLISWTLFCRTDVHINPVVAYARFAVTFYLSGGVFAILFVSILFKTEMNKWSVLKIFHVVWLV